MRKGALDCLSIYLRFVADSIKLIKVLGRLGGRRSESWDVLGSLKLIWIRLVGFKSWLGSSQMIESAGLGFERVSAG